jgi:hypothetical protein
MPRPRIPRPPEVKRRTRGDFNGLTFQQLINKLENVWHPNGDTFLEPGTVGKTSLKLDAVNASAIQSVNAVWTPPTYRTNYADFLVAGYWKNPLGEVSIRGVVRRDVSRWTAGDVIFTLPDGYRPQRSMMVFVGGYASNAIVTHRVDIETDGDVVLLQPSGTWTSGQFNLISLDNIRFPTGF